MKSLVKSPEQVNTNSTPYSYFDDPLFPGYSSRRQRAIEDLERCRAKLRIVKKERLRKAGKKQFYLDEVIESEKNSACIRSITEQGRVDKCQAPVFFDKPVDQRVIVFPGRVDIRAGHIIGQRVNNECKKRGVISSFSLKARRNQFKRFGEINEAFQMWQTLTFADDVMEGKTDNERNEFAAVQLHRFSVWLQREFPGVYLFWRKEIETRKSGILAGQRVPHYHVMYGIEGIDSDEGYTRAACKIGLNWVRLTGTEDGRALEVAVNKKSYERIDGRRRLIAYIGKYMAKPDMTVKGENDRVGRLWGYFGKITFARGSTVVLKFGEMVFLKRMLRRYAKKSKRMKRTLGKWGCNTFLMAPGEMIWKLISMVTGEAYSHDYGEIVPELPF
jgi:hypothetical protein